jgi:GNAT superfamily N-acetyltransferase
LTTLGGDESMTLTTSSTERLLTLSARNLAEFFTGIAPHAIRPMDVWACDFGSDEVMLNSCANLDPLPDDVSDLTARLDNFYGYTLAGQPPLMVRQPGANPVAPRSGFRIVEVTTPDELAIAERGFVDWYPLDHFTLAGPGDLFPARSLGGPHRYFLGYEADQPVCVALAYPGDEVIGIYCVATSPDARGKGYGAAITDAAAQTAPQLPAVLQASDMGRPVYERIGFETVGRYDLWTHPRRPAQTAAGASA